MENDLISRSALINEMESHIYWGDSVIGLLEVAKNAPAVEAEPKWISVKERLPENELAVIAYSKEDGHAWYAFRRGGLWWRPGDRISVKVYGTVTHWMPLPEPPKEE